MKLNLFAAMPDVGDAEQDDLSEKSSSDDANDGCNSEASSRLVRRCRLFAETKKGSRTTLRGALPGTLAIDSSRGTPRFEHSVSRQSELAMVAAQSPRASTSQQRRSSASCRRS